MGMSNRKEVERQGRGKSQEAVSNNRDRTLSRGSGSIMAEFNHEMDIKFVS